MERVNGYIAYLIGVALGPLGDYIRLEGMHAATLVVPCSNAIQVLEQFVGDLRLPLRGSKTRAMDIMPLLKRVIDQGQDAEHMNEPLPAELRGLVWNALIAFQNVFQTECAQLPLYLISEKRGWDMATMSDRAEFTFSGISWASLSPTDTLDVRSAGRCLAFEIPTAAAFHMYRVLESTVLKYMPLFGVTLKESERNLGRYISILRDNGVDVKITVLLEHIKDQYRNPAIHPGLFFDTDEAAGQFALIQSAIHLMAYDLFHRLPPTFA